ncbi:MAG: type VI secretion system tip protein VgrG [Polyangiaceae bacterium]|nr:type VI secretion system tip protein VgrG [Polyangiaceae bacterium]
MALDTTGSFTLVGDKLPGDAFATRFEAYEAISEPYDITVEFYTLDASFRVADTMRTKVCLVVADAQARVRYFDGIVERAEFVHFTGQRYYFRLRLRPALSALAHREDSRIFQEKTVIQVIQQMFEDAGFGDKCTWRITKEYQPHEFIVQYRESMLNFASRLMEEHGIFYYFAHSTEGHQMIIGDDPTVFAQEDELAPAVLSLAQGGEKGTEHIENFIRTRTLRTNIVHLQDYDFEKPQVKPDAQQPGEEKWMMPYYEYPARFLKSAHGQMLANARMRELRRHADIAEGTSHAIGLRCGCPFTIEGGAEDACNGDFVVTELVTHGEQHTESGKSNMCDNRFRAIPKDAPYAPARRARRPRIRGVQTAIVTGSSTQEQTIHTEKYGRIKVRFYWDRINQQDHTSSCWIRVSQIMAGGTMILPRVGWEVSVAFLEGDPDKPVVLGRLYNAEKTPPYALPGAKTSGALKSYSSPGAGGHNEINAGDSGGSQGFNVHAQKDYNIVIEHDKKEEVGVDEEQHISCNQNSTVGVDESMKVGGNQTVNIGSVMSHKIAADQSISVSGNDVSNAISNYVEKIGGDRSYSVGGRQLTICNTIKWTVQGDFTRKVGSFDITGAIGSVGEKVGGNYKSDVGLITAHVVNGSHGETITGNKNQTSLAAELHMTKGGLTAEAKGSVTNLVGGLHYNKLDGDYVVKAPMITLLGAVGVFKGGSTDFKLGGGPVTVKASKIAMTGALIVKFGASMKMGSG